MINNHPVPPRSLKPWDDEQQRGTRNLLGDLDVICIQHSGLMDNLSGAIGQDRNIIFQ